MVWPITHRLTRHMHLVCSTVQSITCLQSLQIQKYTVKFQVTSALLRRVFLSILTQVTLVTYFDMASSIF